MSYPATGLDASARIDNVVVTHCCNAALDANGDGVTQPPGISRGTDPADPHSVLLLVPGGLVTGGTTIS